MRIRIAVCCLSTLAVLLAPSSALADTAATGFQPALPLEYAPPKYPQAAQQQEREGWVVLAYVITTEGTVRDVFVEDSSGQQLFERAAVDAVSSWLYHPARRDGVPVETTRHRQKITFRLEGGDSAATELFGRQLASFRRDLARNDLERAAQRLERMRARPRWNLYEDAWYWWARSLYEEQTGDQEARRLSLRRAVAYEEAFLPPDVYVMALRELYVDYIRTGELQQALQTFARLQAVDTAGDMTAELADHAARVREHLVAVDVLEVQGVLGNRPWSYHLTRNAFELADVTGDLQRLEVLCDQHAESLAYQADVAWNIPERWGDCRLYVHGAMGSRFTLLEYMP